jgi:hypothetical protein
MRTVMVVPGTPHPPRPIRGRSVPAPQIVNGEFRDGLRGWNQIPQRAPFHVVRVKGRNYLTTYDHGGAGDGAMGAIYQDFTPNWRTCWLDFRVHGGHGPPGKFQQGRVAAVRLYHRGQIVRETFGLDDNARDVNARWNLEEYRGEPLRLVVADATADRWGFISAAEFRLVSRRPLGRPRYVRCGDG